MNMDERNQKMQNFFDESMGILAKKGKDYNPTGVAFKDVRDNAAAMGLTPEQVVGVFMSKHYAAVQAYIKNGATESEPIAGRLMDLANYCAMLAVMAEDKSRRQHR